VYVAPELCGGGGIEKNCRVCWEKRRVLNTVEDVPLWRICGDGEALEMSGWRLLVQLCVDQHVNFLLVCQQSGFNQK
jgi:hypothetical protein